VQILTIDLGTSATKAVLWSEDGPIAVGRAAVDVGHPRAGWVEQDPEGWWTSTLAACAQLPAEGRIAVDAVGFSTQRDTFVPVTTAGEPIGPAITSADRRATAEATGLGEDFHVLTGVVPDAGAVAAKVAWLRKHEPDRLGGGQRWIFGPRDLIAFRLTGRAITDASVASRTGLIALDGAGLGDADLLPEIVGPTTIIGDVLPDAAAALGLRAGTPVVAGAGDRACEVLGVAATTARPMVSWGTVAGVSVPVGHVPAPDPGIVVSRGALGGYVMEADLPLAGSALEWLGRLTGKTSDELARRADDIDAGAGGLIALAWLGGARAPWWDARTGLTFVGLSPVHTPAHLARALVEGLAFDAVRCLDRAAPDAVELSLAGAGAAMPLWRRVLAGVANRPVVARTHGEAASAGAAIVAGRAIGSRLDPDRLDPVSTREDPFDSDVVAYGELRMRHEMVARATVSALIGR
jgi:xylulokinase